MQVGRSWRWHTSRRKEFIPSRTSRPANHGVHILMPKESKSHPSGGTRIGQPRWLISLVSFALLTIAGFLGALVLIGWALLYPDKLAASGLAGYLYYIALLPLALATASFLFLALQSYADYTGKQFGGTLKLGGPVVVFMLVVIGGFVLPEGQFRGWSGDRLGRKSGLVVITSAPMDPPGNLFAREPIKGYVTVANPQRYRIVVYANDGVRWWVQPLESTPLTSIGSDGKWETRTHGGVEFAVLLVEPTFQPDQSPDQIARGGGDILEVARAKPKSLR